MSQYGRDVNFLRNIVDTEKQVVIMAKICVSSPVYISIKFAVFKSRLVPKKNWKRLKV